MVRLPDRPDMTLDVYRGRKTTMQQLSSFVIRMLPFGDTVAKSTMIFPRICRSITPRSVAISPHLCIIYTIYKKKYSFCGPLCLCGKSSLFINKLSFPGGT